MFSLFNTTRRAVSTMTSSIINESTQFSVSFVTVPNDEVANKLAEYVYIFVVYLIVCSIPARP